jgi:hypothetical protein
MSKTLIRIAETDPRVSAYEHDPGNESGKHWIYLVDGWNECGNPGSHTIHEHTVADCLRELRNIEADTNE